MAEMKAVGINCGIHYEHCHNRSYFNCDKQYLPISELESKQTVSIPFHEKLTKEEIQKVIIYATKFSKL
jgi:dTDP-4-amino-4,6-dideoxygalactose transaminase